MKPRIRIEYHCDTLYYCKPTVIVYLKVLDNTKEFYISKGCESSKLMLRVSISRMLSELFLMVNTRNLKLALPK